MDRELTKEEIDLLIKRVKRRISRLELWLYQSKFKENSKYGAELEHLRKLKSDLVTAKKVKIYCKVERLDDLLTQEEEREEMTRTDLEELERTLHKASVLVEFSLLKENLPKEVKGFIYDAGACLSAGLEELKKQIEQAREKEVERELAQEN